MKLSLYYPLPVHYVTQKFGETAFLDYYKKNGIEFTGHNGADLVANHGDTIRASHDGMAYYQIDSKQGHGVVIITEDQYEYKEGIAYFKSIYWHMVDGEKEPKWKSPLFSRNPNIGTRVKAGDIIGYADNTGLSDGTHLHYALKPMKKVNGRFINIEDGNGFTGCIDPIPYCNGRFAYELVKPVLQKRYFSCLSAGMRSPEVTKLQRALSELGYFTYPSFTEYYGKETQKAVLAFQLETGVVKFGIESLFGFYFGEKSKKALTELINK